MSRISVRADRPRYTTDDIIHDRAGARRRFCADYRPLVCATARTVRSMDPSADHDDMENALWLHIFARDCALLRAYSGSSTLGSYLSRCLRNKALDIIRAQKRQRTPLCCCEPGPGANRDHLEWRLEKRRAEIARDQARRHSLQTLLSTRLDAALESLPPAKAAFLRAALIRDEPTATIMADFAITNRTTVYTRRKRAIAALRHALLEPTLHADTPSESRSHAPESIDSYVSPLSLEA